MRERLKRRIEKKNCGTVKKRKELERRQTYIEQCRLSSARRGAVDPSKGGVEPSTETHGMETVWLEWK